ncbi:MAG: hypothetical protein RQ750_17815 [Roseovarius sp.]|nr:hypothetical protein [Roseovarius sp.]
MRLCPTLLLAPLMAGLITSCAPFPRLEESESARNAPFAQLVPAEQITGQVPPQAITPDTAPDLTARAARLKARAARLKGSVVDTKTQERMQTGVN